jgi:hypothetical protein
VEGLLQTVQLRQGLDQLQDIIFYVKKKVILKIRQSKRIRKGIEEYLLPFNDVE